MAMTTLAEYLNDHPIKQEDLSANIHKPVMYYTLLDEFGSEVAETYLSLCKKADLGTRTVYTYTQEADKFRRSVVRGTQ